MRKLWDIHGGVHPPENKHQSVGEAIADMPLPSTLVIALNQHIGAPAQALVKAGDKVLKGQVVGQAQGIFSANVHASSSGTVVAVEHRVIAHPSGLTALCVVIEPDGLDQWCELKPCENYDTLDHYQLVERIQLAGLAGMGGAGFPTSVKLNPKSVDTVETLILNGTECEPYITADDMLMREHAQGVVEGAKLLARIVGTPKSILIGVEDNKPEAISALQAACEGTPIEVVSFPTKYPSGGEKQLIQILTGKELPSGKLPAQIGVLVQNVGTAYAAWRAVKFGEPLIERITTVVGESLTTQRNVRTRIGTPIRHLLEQHGFNPAKAARVIIGGPMMGFAITDLDAPVVKTTNCVLAPSHAEMPAPDPAQPCIRCGLCAEACPAQLLPQQLYWYARADDTDRLQSHNLFDCIECGACSFVCPSSIPLVQYYRSAKGQIRQQEAEKLKSDRARIRFDQRKERMAKAEAEKEAKRLARKQAAEEAKKQLANKAAAENETVKTVAPADAAKDLVAQAMAKAKTQQDDPAAQRKKLERGLSSAQSRLARAEAQLQSAADDASREKLSAAVKQAELKVADARKKLDELSLSKPPAAAADPAVQVAAKLNASPLEAQQKAVASLTERVAKAEQKLLEAKQADAPTVQALAQGLKKLKTKLLEAEEDLATLVQSPGAEVKTEQTPEVEDAAALAIAKAQAKAQAATQLSPEEKQKAQREALAARLQKAEQRLAAAEAEQSEHVETLRDSVAKLKAKLAGMPT